MRLAAACGVSIGLRFAVACRGAGVGRIGIRSGFFRSHSLRTEILMVMNVMVMNGHLRLGQRNLGFTTRRPRRVSRPRRQEEHVLNPLPHAAKQQRGGSGIDAHIDRADGVDVRDLALALRKQRLVGRVVGKRSYGDFSLGDVA